ncbi:MAG: class I SAM-dependent rRNA methyltransferase [Synergistes sp.]|nr:class I SAM-dependent rRNA methyltransferase [Synergistes sp.]
MPENSRRLLRRAVLNESGAERVRRGHPWIFRGNIIQAPQCAPGDIIPLEEKNGSRVAWGLWSESELCIRILSFGSHEPDQMTLLRRRAERALEHRRCWCPGDESFRWVHGEGDGLPGITADLYGDTLVLQLSAMGWYRHAEEVAAIFRKVKKLSAVILRNDTKHLEKEGIPREIKPLLGEMPASPIKAKIAGFDEYVDISGGQKTGAYLDVRSVPALLDSVFRGAAVLDCFSYQGHFTLRALARGAASVTAVDQSKNALDAAARNIDLNSLDGSRAKFVCGNAFDILRNLDAERARYDIVIMDPPPFSPAKGQLDAARRGYKELAVRGLRRLSSGGYMLFMSCSHAFSRDMLLDVLLSAAVDVKANCRVVTEISQPPDHPALLAAPETNYLKGFVIGVE